MAKAKPKDKAECLEAAKLAFTRGQLHALFTMQERNTLEAAWADYADGKLSIEELRAEQEPIAAAAEKRRAKR